MAFQTTRITLQQLDRWVSRLAAPHLPLNRVLEPDGSFHWEFGEQNASTLQIGKGVRMVSGIRAAMLLADNGYLTECVSLLRMVSDFAQEIIAIGEGMLEGRMTTAQQEFIDQYFAPVARTPEELEQHGRQFYVSRDKLLAAHQRLSDKANGQSQLLLGATRFLNYGYDKYVHGGYLTAMELYRGDEHSFMLAGSVFGYHRCCARRAVSGKLHEVLHALEFMALGVRDQELDAEIRAADERLTVADEQSTRCS